MLLKFAETSKTKVKLVSISADNYIQLMQLARKQLATEIEIEQEIQQEINKNAKIT